MPAPPPLQSKLVHAYCFASLTIQVSEHLFPGEKLFALSADQRRIVDTETQNLMLQARWKVESKGFADLFAVPQVGVEKTPAGTVLGDPVVPSDAPPATPGGGGYH